MPDMIIIGLEIGAIIAYLLSVGLYLIRKKKISDLLWIIAVLANGGIVINNWIVNGYVPFVSMYQVLTFLSLIFAPIYLIMKYTRDSGWMKVYFSMAAAICMIGVCFMSGSGVWHFPPALQSMWFVPHILAYMIGYSLITVAFIITVISLFSKDDKYNKGIYNLTVTAFPFMTMGMLFGAIWADAVWGDFWSFDGKENWSLVTWLMIVLYLHFRREKDLAKYSKIFVILGFVGVVITMLFVNMMGGNSQHSYSM